MSGTSNNDKLDQGNGETKPSPKDKHITVTVIVNGTGEEIRIKTDQPLQLLLKKALDETENTGQPIENWELRNEAGAELALDQTVEQAGIKNGDLLSANLKTGAAGAR